MPLNDRYERTVHDFHRLTHNKFKKVYFKRHPRNPNEIQVIRYFFNIITGSPQQQVGNFHVAEPTEDMVEMTPEEEGRMMRMKNLTQSIFY
tara:strand:- start:345 stop:617 length:273 start_codon:yes stop_codon:yes gene_type:complete